MPWSSDTSTAFILNLDSVTPAELSAECTRHEDCTHYYRSTGMAKTGGEIHGPDGEQPRTSICTAPQGRGTRPDKAAGPGSLVYFISDVFLSLPGLDQSVIILSPEYTSYLLFIFTFILTTWYNPSCSQPTLLTFASIQTAPYLGHLSKIQD